MKKDMEKGEFLTPLTKFTPRGLALKVNGYMKV